MGIFTRQPRHPCVEEKKKNEIQRFHTFDARKICETFIRIHVSSRLGDSCLTLLRKFSATLKATIPK